MSIIFICFNNIFLHKFLYVFKYQLLDINLFFKNHSNTLLLYSLCSSFTFSSKPFSNAIFSIILAITFAPVTITCVPFSVFLISQTLLNKVLVSEHFCCYNRIKSQVLLYQDFQHHWSLLVHLLFPS